MKNKTRACSTDTEHSSYNAFSNRALGFPKLNSRVTIIGLGFCANLSHRLFATQVHSVPHLVAVGLQGERVGYLHVVLLSATCCNLPLLTKYTSGSPSSTFPTTSEKEIQIAKFGSHKHLAILILD